MERERERDPRETNFGREGRETDTVRKRKERGEEKREDKIKE